MPTTTRQYRMAGMTRLIALSEVARVWTGDQTKHHSLLVDVETPTDLWGPTRYVYECTSFMRALSIIDDTYAQVPAGTAVRVEWV